MTLPTVNWRVSPVIAIPHPGVALTGNTLLSGINAAFTADTGNHFEVATFVNSAACPYMLIRRKVSASPTGTLAQMRMLLTCLGTSPGYHADALNSGVGASSASLYGGICEDANINTLAVLPADGNPFPGKKNSLLNTGMDYGSLGSPGTPNSVQFATCETCCLMMLRSDNGTQYANIVLFGEILEDADTGAGVWGHILTPVYQSASSAYPADTSGVFPSPGASMPYGAPGSFYNVTAPAGLGFLPILCNTQFGNSSASPSMSQGGTAYLAQAAALQCPHGTGTYAYNFKGIMRQMRFGPFVSGTTYIRDAANVVQAIGISGTLSGVGQTLYLTQVP